VIFLFSRLSEPAPSAEQQAFGIVRRAQRAVAAAVVMTLLEGERQYYRRAVSAVAVSVFHAALARVLAQQPTAGKAEQT
jgi:uncharacterized protein (UPF0332 family)